MASDLAQHQAAINTIITVTQVSASMIISAILSFPDVSIEFIFYGQKHFYAIERKSLGSRIIWDCARKLWFFV
jgi:hypothetical protein